MKALPYAAALLCLATLLAGCGTARAPAASSQPSVPDRQFTVPVYGNDAARADATAKAQCRKQGLYHHLLRNEGARVVYRCTAEAPAR